MNYLKLEQKNYSIEAIFTKKAFIFLSDKALTASVSNFFFTSPGPVRLPAAGYSKPDVV